MTILAASHMQGPPIDWAALSPFVALTTGGLLVLLLGLLRPPVVRERMVPLLTLITLGVTLAFEIAHFKHRASFISGALRFDDLALVLDMVFVVAAIAAVALSTRIPAVREAGHGEYHSLLLFSLLGMAVLVSAQNLVTLFLGFELLSIPLYVLCAAEHRREGSLESGLKYLVIGSVGSATLVYGLALVYGSTGSTDFSSIGAAVSAGKLSGGVGGDSMLLTGVALVVVGFAFKASVAPFHQWTPDVYEGAPTPITAFMATATKAAALGVFLRFFNVAVIGSQNTWAPMLAALAAITMIVGNIGALGQSSLKRMLGYSGVAQAGYMLGGVVVGTRLGVDATVLYIAIYLGMNLAAFAVVVAVEKTGGEGDHIGALRGLGSRAPWLAWPMTIAMLALAGIPGTAGFIGKFQLIHALVDGNYTWLAIVLVVASMISLGYYLRVVATMWMTGPAIAPVPYAPIAGGSQEADADGGSQEAKGSDGDAGLPLSPATAIPLPEIAFVALLFAAATVFFGIFPSPLFDLVNHAGAALSGLVP
ncbi:MAG: NADH-quinone oxidoreductase subunit N [Actinobacteria bacterium]|nr:MAG: NADH-quinone oxidoreductase subunit N [Actinomycetota bacterium]